MKYEKAEKILPKDIIELLQDYIDGGYLYIPRKNNNRKAWGECSGFRRELESRNIEIYSKYIEGMSVKELTKEYYLSENSIRRIIREKRIK